MKRPGAGAWKCGWLGAAVLLAAGCSMTPANRVTFFPEGHRLTDTAKALRDSQPEPWPLPRELDKRVLPPYVVEPGDVLLVQPADLDSPIRLPGDQPVLTDGTVNLGRYGRLVVAGLTTDAIESAARAQVQGVEGKDPGPVSVRVVTRASKVFYVLGEVNAPGAYPLQGRETVLDALLVAGGLTDRASRRNIILTRPTPPGGCRVVLPVCYNDIVQVGDTATNYQVAPGDRIVVPSRTCSEDFFHRKPECPPCGQGHAPCPPPGCAAGHGPYPDLPPPIYQPAAPAARQEGDKSAQPAGPAGEVKAHPAGEAGKRVSRASYGRTPRNRVARSSMN